MPKLTFYPLGNADCCLIDLADGQKMLFDFADMHDPDDDDDRRIDLQAELRKDLQAAKRNHYEVVSFSHLDKDHYNRFSEFFYLEFAEKYQNNERVKINTMWVPAAIILEEGLTDEARTLRDEARHRLIKGKGIRVFSRPDWLKEWLASKGIALADRMDLISDAGTVIPKYTLEENGVEFFIHSPFAMRLNENEVVDRNRDSIVVQAAFLVEGVSTKVIYGADMHHDILMDIVNITKAKQREERLEWDIFKLPHHCSYRSLAPDGEKGEDKTEPVEEVKWLFEDQGRDRGIIVSTSCPIPTSGDDTQPPHRQAANYYKEGVTGPQKWRVQGNDGASQRIGAGTAYH